jgi:hypothetical protein
MAQASEQETKQDSSGGQLNGLMLWWPWSRR